MADAKSGYIGRAVPRIDDDRLLRGLGRFIDDLPAPAETLYLAFARSPHAHAEVRAIRVERARALPDVVAVATAADLAGLFKPLRADNDRPGFHPTEWPAIASDRVRYVGEIVAAVAARTRLAAQDALEAIVVDYAPLPPVVTVDDALAPGAPILHEAIGGNVLFEAAFKAPGFDQAFAGAAVVVEDVFTAARIAPAAMEPRGGLAIYDRGRGEFTYHATTQMPHLARAGLAEVFDLPAAKLRIVAPDIGGGFGPKAYLYPEDILALALARKLDRPLRWQTDRGDDLATTLQARDHRFEAALALDRDGIIQALRVDIRVNAGAYAGYPFGASIEAGGGAAMMPGPYRLKHYAFTTKSVASNCCPAGAYRGVAQPTAFFTMEGLMDRAAAALELDPAEIRLRNVIRNDEFPYVNAVGIRYDVGSYEACLRRALELSDYAGYRRRTTSRPGSDGRYRGIGIACITEHTGQGATRYRERGIRRMPGFDGALVKLTPDGRAQAFVSQVEIGQGSTTAIAQIVADRLGVDIADVAVVEGDTQLTPHGSGTGASRGAVAAGGAALRAADKVGDKIRRIAADFLEASPTDMVLADGFAAVAGAPRLRVALAEIAAIAYAAHDRAPPAGETFGLEATEYYDPPHVYVTNATHVAQVAVDAATGRIAIERYLLVHDCGRVINPMLVDGQIHGGVVQGLGEALMERIVYDRDGGLVTGQFQDYAMPIALDFPAIEVHHIETPSPETAGGFKGVGEGGVIGALPALAGAVRDALAPLGVTVDRVPLDAATVRALIERAAAR